MEVHTSDPATSLQQLLRTRRTIHNFKPTPAPEDALLRAIETARWAPNHRLTEPWRFYSIGPETASAIVERNAELVEQKRGPVAAANKRARWSSMPGWFLVTCRRSDDPLKAREDYGACCCAVQNLLLSLWSEGIGTKWGTGDVTRDMEFFRIMDIDPDAEEVVGLYWYGYPDEVPTTQRKPVDEIIRHRP